MHIGEAAQQSGVTAKTIRYYEGVGLLVEAPRNPNGYRDYSAKDVETLRFANRARGLGFSVREVGELLELYRDRQRASADVKAIAQARIDDINRKLEELEAMRSTLQHLASSCHGDSRPDCPILAGFAAPLRSGSASG